MHDTAGDLRPRGIEARSLPPVLCVFTLKAHVVSHVIEFDMMPSDPHPKLDVFELLSSRRPRHRLGIGLVRAGSTCTDGLEGSPGRSDSHFRGGCGQRAARRALRFVRGRAGGYARARGRAREKNRRGCAWRTTFSKRGVGFGATLAKTSCRVNKVSISHSAHWITCAPPIHDTRRQSPRDYHHRFPRRWEDDTW